MKLFAAKLALYAPSVAVLSAVWVSFYVSIVPDGRYPLTTALSVMGMIFGLSWILVYLWVGVSKFVNRCFGG